MSRVELRILYKDGNVNKLRCIVNKWKFQDSMMGEQYLTFTITSETPIDWAVGDFCQFRGETYTLNYVPSVTQKAGNKERQDAYTYENVKFESYQEELTRCLMLDITASTGEYVAAQGTNYTGSSKFTLFCGESYANGTTLTPVCVLAAKMQANLDRMYGGANGWKVFVDTSSTYVNGSGETVLVTHTEDKSLTFDNTSVAQALAEVHNTFDLDYCIRGRNIYIGYNLKNLTSDNDNETFAFGYGKGYASRDNQNKALFQIKRIANPQQKIVTRLRAFGSTKNMPYRYYNRIYGLSQSLFPTNLQLPDTFASVGTKNSHNAQRDSLYGVNPLTNLPNLRHVKGDSNDAYIDKGDDALSCPEGVREDSARWDGSDSNLPEIYPTIEEATYGELRGALVEDQDGNTGYGSFPNYSDFERIDKMLAIGYLNDGNLVDDANKGDGILPESGISSTGVPRNASIGATYLSYSPVKNSDFTYINGVLAGKERTLFTIQGVAPGKYAMAPTVGAVLFGFNMSCYRDGCSCEVGYKIQIKAKNIQTKATTVIATYNSDFLTTNRSDGIQEMELPELPDVKEQNPKVSLIQVLALSDITVTFTPIIRNVVVPSDFKDSFSINYQVGNSRIDHDITAEPEYTWFPTDDSDNLTDRFHVFVQDMGFDIQACWTDDTPVIAMKSGNCVGREFEILSDVQKVIYGGRKGYMLTLKRATDESLNTYYPSQTDPISAGDHFVMLGVSMPDAYVKMAEVRLLRAATDYLADNCETKFTYQPYIDDLYLQRNLDAMIKAETPNKSIFWRLYAGLKFTFRGVQSSEDEPAPLADITIEKVTISMGDGLTPKVELTLNDDVQQSTLQKLTTSVDRIYNGSLFSGGNVSGASTAVAAAILSILESEGGNVFLSKKHDDTAEGKITFNDVVTVNETLKAKKGLTIGNFQSRFLGRGAVIDEEGNAEFESIYSRNFISTPEFRFNRVNVTEGENWCTNGFGTIQEVEIIDEMTGYITLKLEVNDYASIKVGDICRGIYNDIAHQYETKTLEDDSELYDEEEEEEEGHEQTVAESVAEKMFGFSSKEGFFTSYFWVRQMVTNEKGYCKFIYELRNTKTPHPCEFMKFAQYGSFTDTDRRSSSYSTSIGHYYEMVLDGVSTWKIHSANVVYRKGYLGNMTVQLKNGKEVDLKGYGLYVQDNVYFGSAVVQIDPETLADLEEKLKTYHVDFSDYVDVVTVDDVGNCIGGIYTFSGQSGQYRNYRIHSAISVRKNEQLLRIAADTDDAAEGTYKIYAQPRGCTCVIENSTIYITSIENIKDGVAGSEDDTNFDYDAMRAMDSCYVDLIIDCEGKGSIQKKFPVRILHSATPYVDATINNQFSAVSWNTKIQQYIGLPIPIKVKLWHNNEQLQASSVAINGVAGATLSETSKTITVDGMSIETALTSDGSGDYININIVSLPPTLPLVSVLNITATTEYAGVPYERTITHTINKNTDVNVYSLAPSVTDIVYNPNSPSGNGLSVDFLSCSVFCDSSDNKHYEVDPATYAVHGIIIYYQLFYKDGTAGEPTYYDASLDGIPVATNLQEVKFYLYGLRNGGADTSVVHDSQNVPIIAAGVDGESVEYVFFRQNFLTPYPTLYDDPNERQRDDYLPYTDENHTARWTDDAVGIDEDNKYEFYAIRRKVNGIWQPFGDIMIFNQYHAAQYTVELTDYIDVITVDDAGNVIGGLYTLSGANNEYRNYRIHSAISVRLGQDLLTEAQSGADAGDGTYKIHAQPRGCTCVVENSTIYITGINNIKDGVAGTPDDVNFDYNAMREMVDCSVDLVVDCEGRKAITKRFPITIKHDSQPFISADIDNEFSAVSWNTKTGQYIGLPITFDIRMWHNDENLDIANTSDISLATSTSGVTLVNGTAPATPAASSIYYTKTIETIVKNQGTPNQYSYKVARITITAMGINVPLVTDISVTASAVYSGVTYERTLVHTINKSTDTNVYQLHPSVAEVGVVYNDNKQKVASTNKIYCDVRCDSTDDKHYTVAVADYAKHGLFITYQTFTLNAQKAEVAGTETAYNSSNGVDVTTSHVRVRFTLYKLRDTTLSTIGQLLASSNVIEILDKEDVPVVLDGLDGDNNISVCLDNANDTVMCIEDGTVIASTLPTAKARLLDGEETIGRTVLGTTLAQNKQTLGNWSLVCHNCTAEFVGWVADSHSKDWVSLRVTGVTDDVASVDVKCSYTKHGVQGEYVSILSIKKLYGLDKYEITFNPPSISYNPNTDTYTPQSFTVYVWKTTQEEDRHLMATLPSHSSATDGDVRLQYSVDNGASWTSLTGYSSGKSIGKTLFDIDGVEHMDFRVQKYIVGESGGEWVTLDEEGIEITADGENTIQLIIDNGNDNVMCLEDGTVIASTLPYAKVYLYDGNDMVNTSLAAAAWQTLECENCTASWVSGYQTDGGKKFTVNTVTDDVARVTAKVSYKSNTYLVVHTIKKLYGLDKYEIITEPVSIAYNPNTGGLTPNSADVHVYLTTQEEDRHLMTSLPSHSSATDGDVRLQYSVNNGVSWTTASYSSGKATINSTTINSAVSSAAILLRVQKYIVGESGGEWVTLDEEGIEITSGGADGAPGDDGETYYLTSDINAILKDYNNNFKGSARPTITAWKKVGDSAPVRLADIVDAVSGVAEGMVINAYEMNGNTIAFTNTSLTGVLTCATPYTYVDRLEVELVKGTKTYAKMAIPIIAEQQGSQGLPGCHERVFEVFTAGQTYYNEENTVKNGIRYIDFLALEDNTKTSGYSVYMCNETHVAASTFNADSSYWTEVSVNAASAFFTYLIAKNANIKILASAQFTIAEANGTVVAGLINDTIPLWIGASLPSNAPFRVTRAGVLYATGAEISGVINATGGTIEGTMTVGTYAANKNSIRIIPDDTNPSLVGYVGTTEVFRIGAHVNYDGSAKATFKVGRSYLREDGLYILDADGSNCRAFATRFIVERVISSLHYPFCIDIDSSGKVILGANGASMWPTSKSYVGFGDIYVDGDVLKVNMDGG